MRFLIAAAAAFVLSSSLAAAQVPPCIPIEQAVEFQRERGEEPEMGGRLHTGHFVFVFKTALGDRFTLYMVSPDRRLACHMFSGNAWGRVQAVKNG